MCSILVLDRLVLIVSDNIAGSNKQLAILTSNNASYIECAKRTFSFHKDLFNPLCKIITIFLTLCGMLIA